MMNHVQNLHVLLRNGECSLIGKEARMILRVSILEELHTKSEIVHEQRSLQREQYRMLQGALQVLSHSLPLHTSDSRQKQLMLSNAVRNPIRSLFMSCLIPALRQ